MSTWYKHSSCKESVEVRFCTRNWCVVSTVVYPRIQFFWDVMLCHWICALPCYELNILLGLCDHWRCRQFIPLKCWEPLTLRHSITWHKTWILKSGFHCEITVPTTESSQWHLSGCVYCCSTLYCMVLITYKKMQGHYFVWQLLLVTFLLACLTCTTLTGNEHCVLCVMLVCEPKERIYNTSCMVNKVDPDLWQTGIAVNTALLSIICNSLSKEWCKLSEKNMSVFTSIGSEKVKTWEKVNVRADLW
jgi:hypothetical protein